MTEAERLSKLRHELSELRRSVAKKCIRAAYEFEVACDSNDFEGKEYHRGRHAELFKLGNDIAAVLSES
jgi:hypothetical protein